MERIEKLKNQLSVALRHELNKRNAYTAENWLRILFLLKVSVEDRGKLDIPKVVGLYFDEIKQNW